MARANLRTPDTRPPDAAALELPGVPFARAATVSSTGFALVDARARITWSTAAFTRLTRLRGTAVGTEIAPHLQGAFRLASGEAARAFARPGAGTLELHEGRDAAPVLLHVAALVPGDGARVVVAVAADPERVRAAGGALDEARTDPLTRLGNRALLDARLAEPQHRDGASLALVMVDLDRFKPVNDTLGHAAGDKLLALVADRLKRACRASDTVIRLGGDEFVILHPCEAGAASAEPIAARAVELLGRPFLLDGQQVDIGASAGIASLGAGTASREDLLRHADLALYEAKRAGRGTWRRFDPSQESRAHERRELELRLRRALVLREFELVYQPQVELPGDVLTGFEALIRWNRPGRGTVSPLDFIPLAEELGEIHAIGAWVLREACREAALWPDPLRVAVNVSPVQFAREDFVGTVGEALALSGLDPARLEVEITEGVLIDDAERARSHLDALRALGIGIAMDDFGTGYSSLGYLSAFPFTKIKIDRSFVGGEQSERSRNLVRSILSLGESLGMETLAEGVETAEQLDELSRDGCGAAQGYLISRPIGAGSIRDFIADRAHATQAAPEAAPRPRSRPRAPRTMSDALHRLVYVSRNAFAPDADPAAEIETILAASRRNNARVGISGALMFNAGLFAQVLEGSLWAVERTFEAIQCDARHDDVRVLAFEPVTERRFDDWSMGWAGRGAAPVEAFASLAADTGFDAGRLGGNRVLELLQTHLDEGEGLRRAA